MSLTFPHPTHETILCPRVTMDVDVLCTPSLRDQLHANWPLPAHSPRTHLPPTPDPSFSQIEICSPLKTVHTLVLIFLTIP